MRPIDADAFKKYIDAQEGRPFIGCTVGEAMNILIDEQPTIQPEPDWIPVSERLPEIGKYVLCYLKSRRYFGHYRVCIYRAADKYINHPYFDFNENGFPDVIAWMPLPEPYQKGDK